MSADLIDARIKITLETDIALEAEHQATGRDRSEIAREILSQWAESRMRAYKVMQKRLAAEGLAGESAGHRRESQGIAGSARE